MERVTPAHWEKLKAEAQRVVDRTRTELPPEVQVKTDKVPLLLQTECEENPDLLGTYGNFTLNEIGTANGPIILYLLTIEDYCAEEESTFAEEVRLTYLHELGHHLGWDEDDLEARGLH